MDAISGAISRNFRWTLAVRGIAAIIFGILALTWPSMTLLGLVIIFGVYALVDGVMALTGSLVYRKAVQEWWLILLLAIASIALGILTFVRPQITALVLLLLIAARALVVGGLEIAAAIEYRHVIRHEWLLVLSGIFSVLFGLFVFVYPLSGALAIIWLIGIYALLVGISQVAFSITARPMERVLPAGPEPYPA